MNATLYLPSFAKSVLINQSVSPTVCLCFTLIGINIRGMLHHVCDVAYEENMCGPIRTQVNVGAQID